MRRLGCGRLRPRRRLAPAPGARGRHRGRHGGADRRGFGQRARGALGGFRRAQRAAASAEGMKGRWANGGAWRWLVVPGGWCFMAGFSGYTVASGCEPKQSDSNKAAWHPVFQHLPERLGTEMNHSDS